MRKITCVITMACMLFSITACGNSNGNTGDGSNTQVSRQTDVLKPVETSKNVDADGVLLGDSYKVPGKNIVVDVPNYHSIEHGFTQLFIVQGEKYIAVTAAEDSTATELSAAHADAFAVFVSNIQSNSLVNSLSVSTDSTEIINGIEVYKYEGTLNCGRDTVYDAYAIGYSFIMDGVPCTITGSVINEDQPEDMIAEIKVVVEAMILTLRSER